MCLSPHRGEMASKCLLWSDARSGGKRKKRKEKKTKQQNAGGLRGRGGREVRRREGGREGEKEDGWRTAECSRKCVQRGDRLYVSVSVRACVCATTGGCGAEAARWCFCVCVCVCAAPCPRCTKGWGTVPPALPAPSSAAPCLCPGCRGDPPGDAAGMRRAGRCRPASGGGRGPPPGKPWARAGGVTAAGSR